MLLLVSTHYSSKNGSPGRPTLGKSLSKRKMYFSGVANEATVFKLKYGRSKGTCCGLLIKYPVKTNLVLLIPEG